MKPLSYLLLPLLCASMAYGQIPFRSIQEGETRNGAFTQEESHAYPFTTEKDQFVRLVVVQDSIDLIIEVLDPEGASIGTFDSPNWRWGPERVSFVSNASGMHQLIVKPLEEDHFTGRYTCSFVSSEPVAKTKDGRVDQLLSDWNNQDTPGAAVAIMKDGQLLYSNGYGMANLEYDIPITPTTVFHIASVSKQFTAFAVMLLESDGLLSYEDDIRKHIPELHDFGETITLRHLVHHTSGLRDQWNLLAMAGWRLDDVITKDHIMKLLSRQEELNFSPGEKYTYCNSGFTLLAEVVSRVSGKSFAAFCDERIFQPLGMKQTLFYDNHEKVVKNRAYSYGTEQGQVVKRVLSYANVGATSLFTTVEDLGKWSLNFEDPIVGSSALVEQMNTRGILNNGDTISYAFGQGVGTYKGLKRIGHGGADAGYRTNISRFPDQQFSVIVFSNDEAFNPGFIANKIADIYLEDQLIEEEKVEEEEKGAEEESVEVATEILNQYEGIFELVPGFNIVFRVEEDGRFSSQGTNQGKLFLTALSTTRFKVIGVDAEIAFDAPDENGNVSTGTLFQNGEHPLKRIDAFDPEQIDLTRYVGTYYSAELDTHYTIAIKDDQLIGVHARHPDFELTATSEHQFAGTVWWMGQIQFSVKEDEGVAHRMEVTNGRVVKLKFDRVAD